jgi:hypothetical protein
LPQTPCHGKPEASAKSQFWQSPLPKQKGRPVWAAFSILVLSALHLGLGNTSLSLIHWIKPSGCAGPGYVSL